MDEKDRQLLYYTQQNFPIDSRPFLVLAKQLDITEEEVIERIKRLKEKKYIRKIGAMFDSKKLGYSSTLCAMKVPKDRIVEVANIINKYEGVTHNYLREHSYNMWFTLIAASKERLQEILKEIRKKTEIEAIISLPAIKNLKIKVVFNTIDKSDEK